MKGFFVWDLQDDVEKYEFHIKKCLHVTPFHSTEYLLAEMQAEDGITKIFCYEENGNFALVPEVVRKINDLPYMADLQEDMYDITAPHEYSGIVSNTSDDFLKSKLLKGILGYCNKTNIIFQFIRLNPYLKELPLIYEKNGYDVIHSREQVYVDLRNTEEQIVMGYKSNVRRNIRRAQKEGLVFRIEDKTPDNIRAFQKMYQKAMEILDAEKFLYFNDRYFHMLMECECSRLAFVRDMEGRVLAGSILLADPHTVYYHLGCFDREYSLKRPMNYLMHMMVLWGRGEGYRFFHLGGGGTSLMQFKEGYSALRISYYVAYRVCDADSYSAILEKWKERFPEYADQTYYPLYRYNMK